MLSFNFVYHQLLMEMPVNNGLMAGVERLKEVKYRRSYEDVAEFNVSGLNVEVVVHNKQHLNKPYVRYEMVNNDKIVGLYQGKEIKNNGVITNYAQTEPFVKGESLMFHFYIKFLLKKYDFSISDDSLSTKGFDFYYKNFEKFDAHGFQIKVVSNAELEHLNNLISIGNKNELHKYFGTLLNNPLSANYRFMICKK